MELTASFICSTWARASSYSEGVRRSPSRTSVASFRPMRSPNSSKRARCERAPSYRLMVWAAVCKRSHPWGAGISSMDTPPARRRSTAAVRACRTGSSTGGRIPSPQSRAARCRSAGKRPPKPRDQSSAISAAVAVKRPTVSSEGAKGSAPSKGSRPKLGLKPQMPQTEAGRRTEPRVWVPRAKGTMPAATAAAEPEELPPGVWPGKRGLRVAAGSKEAKAVEGVLRRNFDPGLDVRFAGGNAAPADFQQVARRLLAGAQGLQEFQEHYQDQPSPMSRARRDSCREAASGGAVRSAPEGLLIAFS